MTESASQPDGDFSAALLQSTIERLKARGDVRRFSCMTLPAPHFNDLCARLLDRSTPVRATAEWLAGQLPDAPTRSSVERFSEVLFEEYRLAELDRQTGEAQRYSEAVANGDPEAMPMTLNHRMAQLLTGELLRAKSGESIDTKRLIALLMGARVVAKNTFDKRAMDSRVQAIAAQIRQRDATINLLQQRLQRVPEQLAAIERKLFQAEQQRASGGGSNPHIYRAIREELIRVAKVAGTPMTTEAPAELPAESAQGPDRVVERVREILGIS